MAPQVPTNGAAAPAGLLATVKAKTLAGCWGRQECTAEATAACTDTGAADAGGGVCITMHTHVIVMWPHDNVGVSPRSYARSQVSAARPTAPKQS